MSARTMTLNSPLLRLAKERNEARDLCKRLFYCLPAQGGEKNEEVIVAAYCEYLKASRKWKEGGDE